ncbi:peptide ABC transporter substrate-binding protein [Candidatus Saccharibacteria bacterium]|nr:peptide ABC transporter substrate-binding protein [Candidatus Saccharibacteria bacterium]
MSDDDRKKWYRLPNKLNRKVIFGRMRKVEDVTVRHAHKFLIKRWANVVEVQRHILLWILGVAILISATGLQLMWYQQSYRTTVAASGGTYAEAVLGPVNTLNPLYAMTSAEQSAGYLIFSSLLKYDKTGNLNYDLANSVSVDSSGKQYTISIKPNIKWHDGDNLSADDVVYTVDMMKNSATRSVYSGWENVTVKAADRTTLTFTLNTSYAAFEHALTFPILPKHILKDVSPSSLRENNFSRDPIGSGPFKVRLVQNVDGVSDREVIYLVRNENYYINQRNLDKFQLHVYNTEDEIVKALANNEVNAAADIFSTDVNQINTNRYNVKTLPIRSGVYAILNTNSDTLKDKAIRSALRLATDINSIKDKLPIGTPSLDLPFINGQLSGDIPHASAFDLKAAQETLAGAGWQLDKHNIYAKDGKELKLSLVTLKDSELERVLESISDQWRKLGVDVETKVVDPNDITQNVAQSILQPRNYDVLIYRLNIGADPDVYAYWHSSQANASGSNFSNYSNAISDDALATARIKSDPILRNAKYITFVKQWLSDIPAIGLYQSTTQYVYNKNIKSLSDSTVLISPVDRYSDLMNWYVGTKSLYQTP